MLYRTFIIVAYVVAVLGIAFLFRFVGKRGWNRREKPTPADTRRPESAEAAGHAASVPHATASHATASHATASHATAPQANVPNAPVRPVPPPPVEIRETPIPGSDLRYYPPFGPNDTIFDVWTKLQAFTSNEPIAVRLIPSDDRTPIFTGSFLPDGTAHSTNEMFFLDLSNAIRSNGGPGAWRAVRQLSSFGIPASAREGAYHIYTGALRMELKGVEVMGHQFSVEVTFEPNLGQIPGHFSNLTQYFHCEMMNEGQSVVVGFPWNLTGVTLYSQDRGLEQEGPKIAKAIIGKYERYVRQNQAPVATPEDAARKLTLISDGIVTIAIHEGFTKGSRFLRIEYSPVPRGPIDEISVGDQEFMRFSKSVAQPCQIVLDPEVEAILNTPF